MTIDANFEHIDHCCYHISLFPVVSNIMKKKIIKLLVSKCLNYLETECFSLDIFVYFNEVQ